MILCFVDEKMGQTDKEGLYGVGIKFAPFWVFDLYILASQVLQGLKLLPSSI